MRYPVIAVCVLLVNAALVSSAGAQTGEPAVEGAEQSLVRLHPDRHAMASTRAAAASDLDPRRRLGLDHPGVGGVPAVVETAVVPALTPIGDLTTSDVPGWIGFAKWTSLGVATGLSALGFVLKEDANARFDDLEAVCERDSDRCRDRTRSGEFADPELERMFQDVLAKDRDARISLIAGQVSFAASVAFFILDFQGGRDPGDIPYDPPDDSGEDRFELSVRPGELALRYYPD